jgi:putative ABC transport system permease protein
VRLADNEQWFEITGVVGDVRMAVRPDAPETRLHLYRPIGQSPSRYVSVVLRGTLPPETFTNAVRQAVAALDADLPVSQAGALRPQVDRSLRNVNMVIINLAVSAGMGLLIAAVGLFGVISQLTAQRTRDIGVRIALGAQETDILRMILGEGVRLLVVGVAVGVPLFLAFNAVVSRAMPEMPQPGLWLLALNLAALAVTMLLATYLPARRATRVNPVEALRAE